MNSKLLKMPNKSNIVYSTNPDYKPSDEDNEIDTPEPSEQNLKVWIEKNGRGGKTVSVIKGFQGKYEHLESLAKLIKNKCGVGGSVKDGEIIIQGDHRDKIILILEKEGFKAKKAGG